ncbi:MAG: hypothetical protein R3E09_13545 [Novosphingobium sp.]
MKALVVGGTGPTGHFIVNGLLQRGYCVAILHRGKHEVAEIPPEVEHIHTDPNFRENLDVALEGRTFDLCIASYGRLKLVAAAMVGKTDRFIALGASSYRGILGPEFTYPQGEPVPIAEHRPSTPKVEENKLSYLVAAAEKAVLDLHPEATYFRIPPFPYGPYQVMPREWLIIRRLLDKRPFILLPDGGLSLYSHGYAANLAQGVLLAVDEPEISAGQSYNCADEEQLTLRQIVEVIADTMGRSIEIKSIPLGIANLTKPLVLQNTTGHTVLDLYKIKAELGYRDLVPSVAAIARTTQWLLENPVEPGSHMETMLGDPFDYAQEDLLADRHDRLVSAMDDFAYHDSVKVHPYAHPKERGREDHYGR